MGTSRTRSFFLSLGADHKEQQSSKPSITPILRIVSKLNRKQVFNNKNFTGYRVVDILIAMDFDKFNALVESRLHYGEIDEASVVSDYKNVGCGDGYRLFLQISENKITDASYTTTGCSFSLASLSIICDLLIGKTIEEAQQVQPEDLEPYIDGYPPRRLNYAATAIAAAQKALNDFAAGTGVQKEEVVTREAFLKKLEDQGHLRGEKLKSVMLNDLDLSSVDFTGADLQNAFFKGSKLSGAIFDKANLKGVFFNDCDLSGASIKEADLRFAKLTGAKLENAVFNGSLYDVGTRVQTKDMHIFDQMVKKGKELYLQKN